MAAEAVAQAAQKLVPTWFFYTWFGLFAVACLEVLFIVILNLWTCAPTYLIARLKHQPVIYVVGKDQRAGHYRGTVKSGVCETKAGMYQLMEKSHTIDKDSGVPTYTAFSGCAATLPWQYIALINTLRKQGLDLINWDEYNIVIQTAAGKKVNVGAYAVPLPADATEEQKADAEDVKNAWKKISEWVRGIEHAPSMTDSQIEAWIRSYVVKIEPYETVKLHEFVNMFPYTISPELMESHEQYKLIEQRRRMERLNANNVTWIILIFLGAALAAGIFYKLVLAPGTTTCTFNVPPGLYTAAQTVTQNLTG